MSWPLTVFLLSSWLSTHYSLFLVNSSLRPFHCYLLPSGLLTSCSLSWKHPFLVPSFISQFKWLLQGPVSAISILSCDSSLSSLSSMLKGIILVCNYVFFFLISWFGWFLLAKPLESWTPKLIGTRDQFRGRQFFHGPGRARDGFGMLQAPYIYWALLFLLLLYQLHLSLSGIGSQWV